ncbi:MAG: hypothetical protein IJZ84_04280 [Lachnospiraceae bacterium]|nr:hypothetical protein [Lachnospiraceae bacterium]
MTNKRRHTFSVFRAQEQYIDELLAAQDRELNELRKEPEEQTEHPDYQKRAQFAQEEMTFREKLQLIGGAVGAGLVIAGVFLAAFALLILFCIHVWFA